MTRSLCKMFVYSALAAGAIYAQNIGVGVRGGVPLNDFLEAESKTGALTNVVRGKGDLVIGPMVEVRLPLGLGVEFDALVRRWTPEGTTVTPNPGTQTTWEFPLLGKYRFPFPIARPYAGAGINFQRLGDFTRFISGDPVDSNRKGFVAAGGVEVKVPFIRVSPEIRWTRWNSSGPLRSSNQMDFLVGISF